jgi:hypothetical protein
MGVSRATVAWHMRCFRDQMWAVVRRYGPFLILTANWRWDWIWLGLLRVLRDRLAAIDDFEAFGQLEKLGVGFGETDLGESENLLAD